jgi:hypothetical protein
MLIARRSQILPDTQKKIPQPGEFDDLLSRVKRDGGPRQAFVV